MSAILTNTKVANKMSPLEAKARSGCKAAQDQLYQQSMLFAESVMQDMAAGMDMQERKDRTK